jgi:protein SCO1/2
VATLYPDTFRPLADFELSDQQGQTFTKAALQDRWSLLFFGFTYCPDICPMTLTMLRQVKSGLEKHGITDVQTILISVDPQRDEPARLKEYIAFFDPQFIGLTDTTPEHKQLATLAGSLGVYYGKSGTESGDNPNEHYLIDHSAGIFLIDPRTKTFALFSAPHDADAITRDLIAIINL